MKTLQALATLAGLAFVAAMPTCNSATAQDHKVVAADNVQWGPAPPSLPKGAEVAVLAGDPTKEGPFTLRLKFPSNYKIPAHSHPSFEAVTVISGQMNFGMGDKLDESNAQRVGAGGFIHLPENMNHFAFSSEASVVQIHSIGPFSIKYVNPEDDPSKK